MDQPSTELYRYRVCIQIYPSERLARETSNIASTVLLISGLPIVGAGETFALLTVVNG